jgi:preprotein translocase subunit SecE
MRFFQGIRDIIQETIGELRKVSWPTRQEALNLTWIVLVVIFVFALFLGGADALFAEVVRLLVSIGG